MGEHADDAYDRAMEEMERGSDGQDDEGWQPQRARCRDCLSEDVYWAEGAAGWVLYNFNSRRHVCKDNIVSSIRLDAFDELDQP